MEIYHYSEATQELLGIGLADENPLEPGAYLIPAHATTSPPPVSGKNEAAVWRGDAWEKVPDFRGTAYWTEAGEKNISELGEAPPEGAALSPAPGEFYVLRGGKWEEDDALKTAFFAEAVRRERDARLRACDPQALPDYPHESDGSEQAWLAYRQALRDLPSLPGFPWGGVSDPAIPWPEKPETPAASEE